MSDLLKLDAWANIMISIIVPAHNESSVIVRALSTWTTGLGSDRIDVIVVCNGCTDDTASIARRYAPRVRVIESEVASKTHALNLGDQASNIFPRVYIDADVVISIDAIRALASRLDRGDVLAVAPTPNVDLTNCSWLVRKYFDIRSRLPSSREGIGGSGVYALSEAGRRRFGHFPAIIADDTYVRVQFKPEERETLPSITSTVFAPRTVRHLLAVRTRAYTGTIELVHCFPQLAVNKGETNNLVLMALFKDLRLWPGLLVYCGTNLLARSKAILRARTGTSIWQRDDSSRAAISADAQTKR